MSATSAPEDNSERDDHRVASDSIAHRKTGYESESKIQNLNFLTF